MWLWSWPPHHFALLLVKEMLLCLGTWNQRRAYRAKPSDENILELDGGDGWQLCEDTENHRVLQMGAFHGIITSQKAPRTCSVT